MKKIFYHIIQAFNEFKKAIFPINLKKFISIAIICLFSTVSVGMISSPLFQKIIYNFLSQFHSVMLLAIYTIIGFLLLVIYMYLLPCADRMLMEVIETGNYSFKDLFKKHFKNSCPMALLFTSVTSGLAFTIGILFLLGYFFDINVSDNISLVLKVIIAISGIIIVRVLIPISYKKPEETLETHIKEGISKIPSNFLKFISYIICTYIFEFIIAILSFIPDLALILIIYALSIDPETTKGFCIFLIGVPIAIICQMIIAYFTAPFVMSYRMVKFSHTFSEYALIDKIDEEENNEEITEPENNEEIREPEESTENTTQQ